jgi:hypothetical protein
MLARSYYQYKQFHDQDGIIFSFSGFISEGILFALGDVLKKQLTSEAADPNKIKRVFSVFVELMQNIIRYSAECIGNIEDVSDKLGWGIVIVGFQDEQFYVSCGNIVSEEKATRLRKHLETLQELGKEELRSYYRGELKEKTENLDKGSNLGLIEIARRSSAQIEFDFLGLDANKVFYCIKSYI